MGKIKAEHELKQLQSQRAKVEVTLDDLRQQQEEIKLHKSELMEKKGNLEQRICKIQEANKEPVVTEHAILRYLERVEGVDIERVKSAILTKSVRGFVGTSNGKFPISSGHRVVVKGNTVITIE